MTSSTATPDGFGNPGYRAYVLTTLWLAYVFNFIDRIMVGILAEPIINHFSLTDTQFGLLSGIAFALFYTLLGIPIARLSEYVNRSWLIGGAVLLWSLMTALCGLASSFWMLFLFRLGVGVGEAGLTPTANSLISDYFKPSSRTRALAIYATGITVGMCLASLFVGLTGAQVSWQQTFMIVGLAGIPVGLLILLTVKDAPRGYCDPAGSVRQQASGVAETLRELSGKSSFWLIVTGATLTAFVGYGMSNFIISFLVRNHGISVPEAALHYMVPFYLIGACGTWACGQIVQRFAGGSITVALRITAAGLTIAPIAFYAAFNTGAIALIFPLLLVASFSQYMYIGPMYAGTGALATARTRATAVAILLFIVNLIGYGAGPLFVGWASDYFAAGQLAEAGLSFSSCTLERDSLNALQQNLCSAASAEGLQQAISLTLLFMVIAAGCFAVASARFNKDTAAGV